jgi:hypothetical protein
MRTRKQLVRERAGHVLRLQKTLECRRLARRRSRRYPGAGFLNMSNSGRLAGGGLLFVQGRPRTRGRVPPPAHEAGRQTLPVFVFVWSATQAEARKPPAGLSVTNSHRGRLQMPLQNLAASYSRIWWLGLEAAYPR